MLPQRMLLTLLENSHSKYLPAFLWKQARYKYNTHKILFSCYIFQENRPFLSFGLNKKMDKTRFLSFRSDLAKLRDVLLNSSNGPEEVKSLFEDLTKIYPELHLAEEQLPDVVLKPKERTSTSRDAASVKQKLIDSIRSSERFKDYSGIEIILHNEETCINTLRELDSAERDAKKRLVYFSCLQGQVLKRLKEISGKKWQSC